MKTLRHLLFILLVLCLTSYATVASASDDSSVQPSDFFTDFPDVKFGMSVADAKKAIEKTGLRAAAPVHTQLSWNTTFNQMTCLGTVLFEDGKGLFQITVLLYAMEKRKEMFEQWSKRITEKSGAAEESDTRDVTSRLWKLKDGVMLELRLIKDDNSPVLEIRWVK